MKSLKGFIKWCDNYSVRNICIIALIIVGLVRPVAYLLGSKSHYDLEQLMISPLPLAFDDNFYFAKFFLDVTYVDGQTEQIQITPKNHAQIEGPLNRVEAYAHPLTFASYFRKPLWHPALYYAYCDPGTWIDFLKLKNKVAEATLQIMHTSRSENFKYKLRVDCDE